MQYQVHADIVIQVHGIPIEASSHEEAVRKLEDQVKGGDLEDVIVEHITGSQYEIIEGYPPVLYAIVDEEDDDDYERTTQWDVRNEEGEWLSSAASFNWRLERMEGSAP